MLFGPAVGQAEGSYCGVGCNSDMECGGGMTCTMNQGQGQKFCQKKCTTADDCDAAQAGYKAVCSKNIVSSICSYVQDGSQAAVAPTPQKANPVDAASSPAAVPKAEHAGEDCYYNCDSKAGFCGWCGVTGSTSNACCRKGWDGQPPECSGLSDAAFTSDGHHECVVPTEALKAKPDREPKIPTWPSSVRVFGPEDDAASIEAAVNEAFSQNGGHVDPDHGQFVSTRFAFLFKPGSYSVEVPVGYYTQVLGLGDAPSDVVFTSEKGVYSEQGSLDYKVGALNSFWRSAENFETQANFMWLKEDLTHHPGTDPKEFGNGMLWAVSQAAPLRRIIIDHDLVLTEPSGGETGTGAPGRSSGGYIGNVEVKKEVVMGTQQQWLARNSAVGHWSQANWNSVFVGTEGVPASRCKLDQHPRGAFVTVDNTPVIAEKPYITVEAGGEYFLNIPQVQHNRRGVDYSQGGTKKVSFEKVYVSKPTDGVSELNAKLKAGLHLVLTPGIYRINEPLFVNTEDQVILGLGLATLQSTNGNVLIQVGNVEGVRIGGLLLEAGPVESNALLRWGNGKNPGNPANPGFLYDIFGRSGGATPNVKVKVMIEMQSGHVVGDNVWLWRADHGQGYETVLLQNPSQIGAVITGDDVTMYGLFSEHHLTDQVQWAGDRGAVYFLQMELPYDATADYGTNGYTGLRVNNTVNDFSGYGVGVYHFFRDHKVDMHSGIVTPQGLESKLVSPIAVCLGGQGVMHHILNDLGKETSQWMSSHHGFRPEYINCNV